MEKTIQELMRLDGKVAVVTGGGGHLGLEITRCLVELGAKVIAVGRDSAKMNRLSAAHREQVQFITADLNQKTEVMALREKLPARIDVLVNNALTWPKQPHFEKLEWDDAAATLASGVVSPLYLSRIAFEKMAPQKKGAILNNASMYGMVSPNFSIYRDSGMGNAIDYNAAKAAIIQATRYMAVKGAPLGIRVNAFSPGPFSHPGAFDGKEWFKDELLRMMPMHRIGEAWEIKGVIALLATDLGSYITGANVPVDGGWTAW